MDASEVIMMRVLLFVLFPLLVLGQYSAETKVKADNLIGQKNYKNFIKNPSCEYNTDGIAQTAGTKGRFTSQGQDSLGIGSTSCLAAYTDQFTVTLRTKKLDKKFLNQNCEVSFRYYVKTDPGVAVYAWAENADGVKTSEQELKVSTTTTAREPAFFQTNIPCGAGIVGALTDTAIDAPVVKFRSSDYAINGTHVVWADAYSGPATNLVAVDSISGWQSFTPTGSWTTNTTYAGKFRRVGDIAEYQITLNLSGAPNSTSLSVNLFPGHIIDTSKLSSGTSSNFAIGVSSIIDATRGINYLGVVALKTTTTVIPTSTAANSTFGQSNAVTQSAPITFDAGDIITLHFSVPIVGWSVSQSAASVQCLTNGSCENTFSAQVSSTGVVSNENYDFINGNCTNASPAVCSFNTSFFGAAPNCLASSSDSGVSTSAGTTTTSSSASTQFSSGAKVPYVLTCTRAGTDYRPKVAAPILTGSVTSNSSNAFRDDTATLNCDASSSKTSDPTSMVSSIANAVDNGSNRSCVVTLTTGAFSSTPQKCDAQIIGTTPAASSVVLTSATSVTVHGPDTDFDFTLNCKGPR